MIAVVDTAGTEPGMRRHEPQPQRTTALTTYAPPETPPGESSIGWTIDFLAPDLDPRGRAVISCARLITQRHRVDVRAALGVARDVLAAETVEHCEALSALLNGDWDGTLGDALNAARRV